jgi:hypothetical protein
VGRGRGEREAAPHTHTQTIHKPTSGIPFLPSPVIPSSLHACLPSCIQTGSPRQRGSRAGARAGRRRIGRGNLGRAGGRLCCLVLLGLGLCVCVRVCMYVRVGGWVCGWLDGLYKDVCVGHIDAHIDDRKTPLPLLTPSITPPPSLTVACPTPQAPRARPPSCCCWSGS